MRIITSDRQIVKATSRQSIVSTLEGSGTRCTNCLSEESMILYSSASGTLTKLSQINDEDMENDKTTYKLLPCEHETTESKPLTLTYRVYPSCQPPIVPHSISLMITENAEQHNTLETGSTTWDGATYLVRFLVRHFSELGASGRFIELGAGTGERESGCLQRYCVLTRRPSLGRVCRPPLLESVAFSFRRPH